MLFGSVLLASGAAAPGGNDAQIAHEQVIEAMDKVLIPGAKNDELNALLVKVRPAFVSHLAHAKHLQSTMMATH